MSRINKYACIAVVCAFMAGCSAVRSFVPIDQVIARDFAITDEWQEIRPAERMSSSHQNRMVMVNVEGARLPPAKEDPTANTAKTEWNALALPDGKVAKLELELIDEKGNVYPLRGAQESGNGRGFAVDGKFKPEEEPDYVAVRIKSDMPVRAKEIRWYTFDRK